MNETLLTKDNDDVDERLREDRNNYEFTLIKREQKEQD